MNRFRLAAVAMLALGAASCTTYRGPAPVEERAVRGARAPAPKPPGAAVQPPKALVDGYYTVKQGDTLYSIALDNGADYREVAQWNGLDDPTKLRIGQVLRVKPPESRTGERQGVVVSAAKGPGKVEARAIDSPSPAAKPAAAPAVAATAAEGGAVDFIWPAKGKVLAGFAEPRSKGIDIDGRIGDPVVAAAAGRVTYIGTGIPGLGKLVVIKHDNGFITVYAHNKDIVVKEQQNVTRGQKIAELGDKLHFQIRKGAAAVDPLLYLPKS